MTPDPKITADEVADTIASSLDNLLDDERGEYYGASSNCVDEVTVSFGAQTFVVRVEEIK